MIRGSGKVIGMLAMFGDVTMVLPLKAAWERKDG